MLASVVNNEGVIEAQTLQNQDGKIILMGGMTAGTTNVAGTLDASAASADNTGAADGGFIETSAANVKVADDAVVTTYAENGETGTWLIDPTDFNIESGAGASTTSSIGATTLSTNLATNNVQIQTLAAGTENGDINVNGAVSWSSNNNLTLTAHKDININESITATGASAKLNLEYGQANAAAGNTSTYNVNAKVNLKAGDNFSTKLGSDGTVKEFKVITALGAAGSTTGTDLQGINGSLGGNYVLGADINATTTSGWNAGKGFAPLGDSTIKFTGIFDGLGHTVNNLTINRTSESYVGLFGRTNGATIQNIGVVGGAVKGDDNVGGLVGASYHSTISNAYATGAVTGNLEIGGSRVGGLVGRLSESTLSSAYATGAVSGFITVGGLVGEVFESTISNAYATGTVTGDGGKASGVGHVGGLVGGLYNSSITNAYATGAVTAYFTFGGLVGQSSSSTISNGYYADTTGQNDTGKGEKKTIAQLAAALPTGFDAAVWGNGGDQTTPYLLSHGVFDTAGQVYLGTDTAAANPYQAIINVNQLQAVNNALSAKYVLGNNIDASATSGWNAGKGFDPLGDNTTKFTGIFDGLGHTVNNLTINRTSENHVGLFGRTNGATIQNISVVGGTVKGKNYVGGLVGWSNSSTTISNAYATGAVTGDTFVGGLVGEVFESTFSNAYATGAVTGKVNVGGLVGSMNMSNFSNAYATGAVTGANSVGGLAGSMNISNFSNAYTTGAVTGGSNVGGLAGSMNISNFSNAYATGAVTGNIYVGGLVGFNDGSSITNSFWDTQTSGRATSNGGTGKTTTQMQTLSTFTDAGWDIDDEGGTGKIWRIYEGHTSPLLRSFMTQLDLTGNSSTTTYNGTTQSIAYTLPADNLVKGTAASGKNVGTYTSDLYSSQQGYDIKDDSVLTIDKANATVIANSNTVTYNGAEQQVTGFTATGLVGGETEAVLDGVTTTGGKGTNAGAYTHTASGTDENYNLSFTGGALTIDKANATVIANSNTVTYNGAEQQVTGFTATGLVGGETEAVLDGVTTTGGKGTNAGAYTHTASGTDENYNLSFTGGALQIDKATLSYVATPNTMTAGQTPNLTGGVTGFITGESLASATTGNLLWNTAGNTTQPGVYDITGSGLNALNYDFVQAVANATALTVQAGSIPQPILTTVNSALPSGTPAPTQTKVTTVDVNKPDTAAGGEDDGGFINDPQSPTQDLSIVYNSCDPDKDCNKETTP